MNICLRCQIMHFNNVGHDQMNRSLNNLTRSNNTRVHNVYCWRVYLHRHQPIQIICPCQFSLDHEGCICILWRNDTCTVYLMRQYKYGYQGIYSNVAPRGTTNISLKYTRTISFLSTSCPPHVFVPMIWGTLIKTVHLKRGHRPVII